MGFWGVHRLFFERDFDVQLVVIKLMGAGIAVPDACDLVFASSKMEKCHVVSSLKLTANATENGPKCTTITGSLTQPSIFKCENDVSFRECHGFFFQHFFFSRIRFDTAFKEENLMLKIPPSLCRPACLVL